MDLDAVLLSVQERDKWRHRVEVLTRSLRDTRDRRTRVQARLRRIKRELDRIAEYSEAIVGGTLPPPAHPSIHANTDRYLTQR